MGIPLFYLELCFGQFASLGPVKIWIINPALKGILYVASVNTPLVTLISILSVLLHFLQIVYSIVVMRFLLVIPQVQVY